MLRKKNILCPFLRLAFDVRKSIEENHNWWFHFTCARDIPMNHMIKGTMGAAEIVEGCAGSQVQQISSTDSLSFKRENRKLTLWCIIIFIDSIPYLLLYMFIKLLLILQQKKGSDTGWDWPELADPPKKLDVYLTPLFRSIQQTDPPCPIYSTIFISANIKIIYPLCAAVKVQRVVAENPIRW